MQTPKRRVAVLAVTVAALVGCSQTTTERSVTTRRDHTDAQIVAWAIEHATDLQPISDVLGSVSESALDGDIQATESACLDGVIAVSMAEDSMLPTPDPDLTDALSTAFNELGTGFDKCASGHFDEATPYITAGGNSIERATNLLPDPSA